MKFLYQFRAKCEDCDGEIWTGIADEDLLTESEAISLGEDCNEPWMPSILADFDEVCGCERPFPKIGAVAVLGAYRWTEEEGQDEAVEMAAEEECQTCGEPLDPEHPQGEPHCIGQEHDAGAER